jgi:hypothetical protein
VIVAVDPIFFWIVGMRFPPVGAWDRRSNSSATGIVRSAGRRAAGEDRMPPRRQAPHLLGVQVGLGVAAVLGLFLIVFLIARALAEPFVIDMADPDTYRDDWGGPTLAGVLLVHCGPGLLAAAWAVKTARRRTRRNLGDADGG